LLRREERKVYNRGIATRKVCFCAFIIAICKS
jgi:hypothetical protein